MKITGPDEPRTRAAMEACIVSARNLIESAQAVLSIGKANIAYHLATAALEELGKRELYGIKSLAENEPVPPAWPQRHAQDHIHKLFWCFFGPSFYNTLTKEALERLKQLAHIIHSKRLDGLYVENDELGVREPHNAVSKAEAEEIIRLAEAQLQLAQVQVFKSPTQEDAEGQTWFLRTATDPRTRLFVMSSGSLQKLAELKDVRAWVGWLKAEVAKVEAEGFAAMQAELQRSKNLPKKKTKDKWKIRVRFFSDSHLVRPSVLSNWNEKSDWIKLVSVPGKKNQLILEIVLGDDVPIEALWYYSWGIARHFVTALNIGTMGFWWWRLPEHVSGFYDSIEDLETHDKVGLERKPSLKIDWGENRVLTAEDLARTAMAFAAFPGPGERDKHDPYSFYIGGITFLSLNDVHWQCEIQAFGNFYESLKSMMKSEGDWDGVSPFDLPLLKFLDEMFPEFDERDRFARLCNVFDSKTIEAGAVTLKEASFMKLFCDGYFIRRVQPKALEVLDRERKKEQGG